jgi:hypothetical protein
MGQYEGTRGSSGECQLKRGHVTGIATATSKISSQPVKSSLPPPAEAFTKTAKHGDEVFTGLPNIAQFDAEYRAGATISLPAFHRASRSVGELTSALADHFDHAGHANAYITPGNASGFTPHHDTHETFILQIGGRKHWSVHEPPLMLPHRSQPYTPQGYTPPAPLLEADL